MLDNQTLSNLSEVSISSLRKYFTYCNRPIGNKIREIMQEGIDLSVADVYQLDKRNDYFNEFQLTILRQIININYPKLINPELECEVKKEKTEKPAKAEKAKTYDRLKPSTRAIVANILNLSTEPIISSQEQKTPTIDQTLLQQFKGIRLAAFENFGIQYYIDDAKEIRSWQSQMATLKEHGIRTLDALYSLNMHEYTHWRGVGTKKIDKMIGMKRLLEENASEIIEKWNLHKDVITLPLSSTANSSYYECFISTIKDILRLIEERKDDMYYNDITPTGAPNKCKAIAYKNISHIIEGVFLRDLEYKEIGYELGITGERCRQLMVKFMKHLMYDEDMSRLFPNWNNVKISERVKMGMKIASVCKYQPEAKLRELFGDITVRQMQIFDLGPVDVVGEKRYVIPAGTNVYYREVSKALVKLLRDNCIEPLSADEVLMGVGDILSQEEGMEDFLYEESFILNILGDEELVVKTEDGRYMLREEHLFTNEQKLSRILYDNGGSMTKEEMIGAFIDKYGKEPQGNPGRDGIISYYNGKWHIGEGKEPILRRVARFAKENVIFYLHDIKNTLISEGYEWDEAKLNSYRSYITRVCLVDNGNENHFCLKERVEEYPQYNWRQPAVYGVLNWMLNEINNLFSEKGEKTEAISQSDVLLYLTNRAKDTEYSIQYFNSRIHNIRILGIEKSPFWFEDGKIIKNRPVYENTNFETVGLRGGKYPYFQQIRAIAVNEIKRAPENGIRLADFVSTVNGIMEDKQSRNTVINAIENQMLEPIPVSFTKFNNEKYLIPTGTTLESEPNYKVEIIDNEEQAVEEHVVRANISQNTGFSWEGLEFSLKSDLAYLTPKFNEMGFDFNDSINKFIEHLKAHKNGNLSTVLPQNLYEYWNNNTDKMDRLMYINNLCLFFAPLEKGLGTNSVTRKRSEYFDKIRVSLLENREKCIEGDPIELNSIQTAQTICDYTGLYVFAVANSRLEQ